ncbi:uncharacterized protein LOC133150912 [Syngnathus typhle]|uniref:uncharacterized protein LOC133150912 n=1 Tax=Syngnathus typhle TaxID=161592 RepID=UPI002A699F11|nr:uncharacterized protein LOC133150912 [Syngnathus typhle]
MTLAEGDEGTYTADGTSPVEKFQVQVVPVCTGQATKVTCMGKLGGELDLTMDSGTTPFKWHKDTTEIVASEKYGAIDAMTLTIKSLDDDDEKEFKGTSTDKIARVFGVQVANCLGAKGTVPCQAKLNEALKLGISDTVSDTVTWVKVDGQLPANNLKVGANDVGLKLKDLKAADVGTYKATYNSDMEVFFAVSVPAGGDTKNNKKDNSGGGSSSNNTSTDQVNFGESKPKPEDGSGVGGLSYSPALLVTVTLVHLLLQLAA